MKLLVTCLVTSVAVVATSGIVHPYDREEPEFSVHDYGAKGDGKAHVIDGQVTADHGARWGVPEKPTFRTGLVLFTKCRWGTVAHVRDLVVENLRVEIGEEAFRRFVCSSFCGRSISHGVLRGIVRTPGQEAGRTAVVDLEDCEGTFWAEQSR